MEQGMRRIAAVGMVAVLGLGVVACGSSKNDARTAATESEALTATTPSTAPPTTVPTVASMQPLLLTTAEVGPDWTAVPPSGDNTDNSLPDCLAGLTSVSPDRPSADQEWDKLDKSFFDESIEFAGTGKIADEFAAATALFDGCKVLTLDANGTTLTGTMTRVPLTAGDQSAAYQLTFGANGITLVMDLGIVAVDGYELTTAYGGLGSADSATFADLTAKAVAKIKAGGGHAA
jgi:hypothetical protein